MATPVLVTPRDFTTSRYGQLADNLEAPLNDILARAEQAVQSRLRRKLSVTTYTERWRPTSNTLFVRQRPIQSITSLKRRTSHLVGWQTLDLSNLYYEAEPGYIEIPNYAFYGYEVELVYTAGFPTLPEDLREAIIMQAVLLSFQDLEVYGSGDGRAPGVLYMTQDLDRLLEPYMLTHTIYH